MIKKVIRIENLGCLRKLEPGPGVGQAGKLVGIFAENGSGKTTLVAALRAAHEGTVEPLQERQSLPLAGSPIVELLTSAGTVKHSAEDRKDKQPTGCTRGNPRVQVACQPGGLNVKVRVEEGENAPWDGSWERGPARGAARRASNRAPGAQAEFSGADWPEAQAYSSTSENPIWNQPRGETEGGEPPDPTTTP